MIEAERTVKGKTSVETRFFISVRTLAQNFSLTRRIALNALFRIPSFKGNLAMTPMALSTRAAHHIAERLSG